jgi:hypothetical protein
MHYLLLNLYELSVFAPVADSLLMLYGPSGMFDPDVSRAEYFS